MEEVAREAVKPQGKVAQKPKVPAPKSNKKEKSNKKVVDITPSATYSDVNKPKPVLSEDAQKIVDALAGGERLVDDVIAETGLPAGKVLSNLTILELKGVIKRLGGKRITLN